MLVEINLLPQKEKKSKLSFVLIGVAVFLLILGAVIIYLFIQNKNQELTTIENQITQTTIILEAERNKLATYENSTSVKDLENAIQWAKDQPFDLVYVLQEITKLLPERGFITEFEIDEENKIKQIVQFDTKSEAAYYLHSLLTLEWIEDAVISEAKSTDILKENEDEKASSEKNVVPRYFAAYELRIDVPSLKEIYKKQTEEEGGTTP
jgi:type IV pilus assembly protein PilN